MIFVPYSKYMQMVYGGAGAILFSFYLVYDTQMMMGAATSTPSPPRSTCSQPWLCIWTSSTSSSMSSDLLELSGAIEMYLYHRKPQYSTSLTRNLNYYWSFKYLRRVF